MKIDQVTPEQVLALEPSAGDIRLRLDDRYFIWADCFEGNRLYHLGRYGDPEFNEEVFDTVESMETLTKRKWTPEDELGEIHNWLVGFVYHGWVDQPDVEADDQYTALKDGDAMLPFDPIAQPWEAKKLVNAGVRSLRILADRIMRLQPSYGEKRAYIDENYFVWKYFGNGRVFIGKLSDPEWTFEESWNESVIDLEQFPEQPDPAIFLHDWLLEIFSTKILDCKIDMS